MTQKAPTLGQGLRAGTRILDRQAIDTALLDARLLLQEAGGFTRNEMITREHDVLSEDVCAVFQDFIARRANGEPVHRILGWRDFFGRHFEVSAHTLVPRPDTEILIEAVLDHLETGGPSPSILDLGTGTGVIAVTIAAERDDCNVSAVDNDPGAVAVARRNAESIGVAQRVNVIEGDLFEPVEGTFDMIVSNPPYIRSDELGHLSRDVRQFDPHVALDGGNDGLEFYRRILMGAFKHLKNNGRIALEIGYDQATLVAGIATSNGLAIRELRQDLAGRDRVIILAPAT